MPNLGMQRPDPKPQRKKTTSPGIMADKYEDFDTGKMQKLEEEVADILDNRGRVINYDLAENRLDWQEIGWSRDTGEKALLYLRRKWNEEDRINVKKEKEGNIRRKLWVKQE